MQVLRSSTPSPWPLEASSPSPVTTQCSESKSYHSHTGSPSALLLTRAHHCLTATTVSRTPWSSPSSTAAPRCTRQQLSTPSSASGPHRTTTTAWESEFAAGQNPQDRLWWNELMSAACFPATYWSWWIRSTIPKTTSQRATTSTSWPNSTRRAQTSSEGCSCRRVTWRPTSVRSEIKKISLVWMKWLRGGSVVWVSAFTPSGCGGNRFGLHRVHRGHHQDAHLSPLGRPLLHHALLSWPLNYVWEHWGSGGSFARPQRFAQNLAQRSAVW